MAGVLTLMETVLFSLYILYLYFTACLLLMKTRKIGTKAIAIKTVINIACALLFSLCKQVDVDPIVNNSASATVCALYQHESRFNDGISTFLI